MKNNWKHRRDRKHLKYSVVFTSALVDESLIIDCSDYHYLNDKKGNTFLKLYDVKSVTRETKDVTEICRIVDGNMTISDLECAEVHILQG